MAETNLGKVRMTDSEIEEKINEIIGNAGTGGGYTVLWENPAPSAGFSAQEITLDESLENYKYCEIIFSAAALTGNLTLLSTGKNIALDGYGTRMDLFFVGAGLHVRSATFGKNKISFTDNKQFSSLTNTSNLTKNSNNIPIQVLGYK